MLATMNGFKNIVEELINSHADVNIQNIEGKTALMLATMNGFKNIVEELINSPHADVNIQNIEGKTALSLAYEREYYDIFILLIEGGGVTKGWDELIKVLRPMLYGVDKSEKIENSEFKNSETDGGSDKIRKSRSRRKTSKKSRSRRKTSRKK